MQGKHFGIAFAVVYIAIYMARIWARNPLQLALNPNTGTLLTPLLIPRVAGTEGGVKARNHIVDALKSFGWDVSLHKFNTSTPIGEKEMANIIAKRPGSINPNLTLSAHYDSKYKPEGFIGAIDSAFPCSLMLWLAGIEKEPVKDFDLIFFDGEEAYEAWTDTDSLYGSRELATELAESNNLPKNLVLLDLIGFDSWEPIPSWFESTQYLHKELESINPKIVGGRPVHEYGGYMMDDHIPFLKYNVPCLHLIPTKFPDVWHTLEDNSTCLDWSTMEQWTFLFEEWLYGEQISKSSVSKPFHS